jgi:hypothetical protein
MSIQPVVRGAMPIAACLAFVLTAGCGGAAQDVAPPQGPALTSAPVTADATAKIGQLETERDAAERQLADVQSQSSAEREQTNRRIRALSERVDFEDTAWARLDRIDEKVKALREEMPRMAAARRVKVEKVLRDIAAKRETVEKDMHRTHTVAPEDWSTFTTEVDGGIEAIARDVGTAEGAH